MTEDEAKTKLCHKTIDGHGVFEPGATLLPKYFCAGSACMAWRWLPRYGENPNNPAEGMSLPPTEGYCGLAGAPHA